MDIASALPAAGAVIAGEFGAGAPPLVLAAEESLLRRFDTPKEYVDDVALSRIYIGVHYRFSVDAGVEMARRLASSPRSAISCRWRRAVSKG